MAISRSDLKSVLKAYHVKNTEVISTKVDKVSGKSLSTNDYTTAEKNKLAGIATGAQTNQNAFSNVLVGTTTVAADSPTDTLEIVAGSNVTITPDATNDKITISSTNTTYGLSSSSANGLMSSTDKSKLDGIATGANNYVHPDTASIRHVTDTEKATWNAKETTTGSQAKADAALTSAKSYTDTKVAGLVNSAPETLDTLKELSAALGDDPNFAVTVMAQVGTKVDKVTGKDLSTNDYTTAEKNKLAGIDTGANNYTHPTTSGNKHIPSGGVSGQILRWSADGTATWGADNNTTYGLVTTLDNGLMSCDDKVKLNLIADGANNYTHPTTSGNKHVPSGGVSNQILRWGSDGTAVWSYENNTTYVVATTTNNGLMASTDKSKLDGIAASATKTINSTTNGNININGSEAVVYTHPSGAGNNHVPTGGTSGQILRWSSSGTAVWGAENNTTYGIVNTIDDGLMSWEDKVKLNGIATGATNTILNNTVTSTSTAEAATANAVKTAYDKANHTHPYAATSHSHNDLYYTETEMNAKLSSTLTSAKSYTDSIITEITTDMTETEITAMITEILA